MIVVTWEPVPVEHHHGVIIGYRVTYGAQNGNLTQIQVNANNLSAELQNLETYKLYAIHVAAFTTIGKGPPSHPIVVRSQEGGKKYITQNSEIIILLCSAHIVHKRLRISSLKGGKQGVRGLMVLSRDTGQVFRVLQAHNPTRTELLLRRDDWEQDGYSAAEAIECRFG